MRRLALVAMAALLASGCTGDDPGVTPSPVPSPSMSSRDPDSLASFYGQEASWSECGRFDCATIEVPLDYQNPQGRRVELAMLRRPADDQEGKVGTLFVNPGGPGVSGIQYARLSDSLFTEPVLQNYDIVGWDPRGVGLSTSISCLTDQQTDALLATDGTPDTPVEIKRLITLNQEFTRGCTDDDAELIPELGTFNSARDIDVLRSSVGDERLNYFGASYGTELGAVYADLFPARVGRMVLDGALDPAIKGSQLSTGQLEGFQGATDAFIEDCLDREGCPIGPSAEEAESQLAQLLGDIDEQPLPTQSGRQLTEALATTGMISAMYSESAGWPALRLGLSQALDGDGTVLLALADAYSERQPDGTYASNVNSAFPAISCTDRPGTRSLAQIRKTVLQYEEVSPIFGRTFAWSGLSCRDWPVAEGDFPATVAAKGADPIVVVGTTRDPATPYEWAVSLADSLRSGVLVSRDGDGHTGYNAGNACVDDAVDAYLVSGTVPEDPTTC